jgi:uncharacterized protein (TIGR03067 family)
MKKAAVIVTLAVMCFAVSDQGRSQEVQEKNIPETAIAAGNFKTLVAAVKAAGLLDTLAGGGPFTVLAPTDEAFAKLPKGTVQALLKPENKKKLVTILKLHVAAGKLTSDMAQPGGDFPSLAGTPLKVTVQAGKIMVGSATVQKADIACSNGVIHVIDSVLLPATPVEPKMLVGKWKYTKAVTNGEEKSAEDLAGQIVEITLDSWTLSGGGAKFVMDYAIDSKVTPNTIKFTITESPFGAGMSTGGVVKMEEDTLVVCYATQGGAVPTEFSSKANSGSHLFYLTKTK